jgi:hypothetical protein
MRKYHEQPNVYYQIENARLLLCLKPCLTVLEIMMVFNQFATLILQLKFLNRRKKLDITVDNKIREIAREAKELGRSA